MVVELEIATGVVRIIVSTVGFFERSGAESSSP
jgi:hypothetical protein